MPVQSLSRQFLLSLWMQTLYLPSWVGNPWSDKSKRKLKKSYRLSQPSQTLLSAPCSELFSPEINFCSSSKAMASDLSVVAMRGEAQIAYNWIYYWEIFVELYYLLMAPKQIFWGTIPGSSAVVWDPWAKKNNIPCTATSTGWTAIKFVQHSSKMMYPTDWWSVDFTCSKVWTLNRTSKHQWTSDFSLNLVALVTVTIWAMIS